MVQYEVAQRIVARPRMSLLAISVQVYGEPHLAFRVPAAAFYPAPKVDRRCCRWPCIRGR
jgi:16S rRNA A1518/A1519 N6-dimethyltransferase RsmA/KsgA/DIM1 with predicted DNA glycosylase/AP lyase activity